jgi:hypothetical protein
MKIKILIISLIFGLALTFIANVSNAQTPIKKKSTTTTTTTTTTTKEIVAPTPVTKAVTKKETTSKKNAKPIKGQIVSFNSLVTGGSGKVTKDEAVKLADNGNPIVFKVNKKIYFVYNDDGTFAGKKLAKYANSEFVGIIGKTKVINGINIIIMTMIDSM